jgi:hypothetical protein
MNTRIWFLIWGVALALVAVLGYLGNVVGDYFVDHDDDPKKIKAAKTTGAVVGVVFGVVLVTLAYLLQRAWQGKDPTPVPLVKEVEASPGQIIYESPTPTVTPTYRRTTPTVTPTPTSRRSPTASSSPLSQVLSDVQQKELDDLYRASRSR